MAVSFRPDPQEVLANIDELIGHIKIGWVPTYLQPADGELSRLPGDRAHPSLWREMDSLDLARYKTCLDAEFKKLGKALPDLKSIDQSIAVREDGPKLNDVELAQRISSVIAKQERLPWEPLN